VPPPGRAWSGGIILRREPPERHPAAGAGLRSLGVGLALAISPGEATVPSLVAGLVASLAGFMIDDLFQPYLGTGATLVLSLVASTLVFFVGRKWLNDLRGR
jgi:hypothetical protein